jgi:hypothetical protein
MLWLFGGWSDRRVEWTLIRTLMSLPLSGRAASELGA